MTSGDTHEETVRLLKKNSNFGMKENQIILIKQNKLIREIYPMLI
jgi:hypothetical protein